MTAFIDRSIIVATLLTAAGSAYGAPTHGGLVGPSAVSLIEVRDRDKTGTSAARENGNGSQVPENKPNASRSSFEAEGTGLEPATPCGAPHFQCGR